MATEITSPAIAAVEAFGLAYRTVTIGQVHSAEEAAEARGIHLSQLVKSLVVRQSDDQYFFVLISGTRVIDWPKLRKAIGVTRLSMPPADEALSVTGYRRGTITPFGSSISWPVIADSHIALDQEISIGSGIIGTAIHLGASDCMNALSATVVEISSLPKDQSSG